MMKCKNQKQKNDKRAEKNESLFAPPTVLLYSSYWKTLYIEALSML